MIKSLALLPFLVFFPICSVNAALISFGPFSSNLAGGSIVINGIKTPSTVSGDAAFTLSVGGDFDSHFEFADVTLDGFNLGRIFNNITDDDMFNFGKGGDDCVCGNGNDQIDTSSTLIPQAVFASMISDGLLDFSFEASERVDCCSLPFIDSLSVTIVFDDSIQVSSPSSIVLLGIGIMIFCLTRTRSVFRSIFL